MTVLSFLQEALSSWMQTFALLLGATLWFKSGTSEILVNASGQPILCADCPCGINQCGCTDLPATLHLTISGSGSCNFDGTYALTWDGSTGWYYTGTYPVPSIGFACPSDGSNACAMVLTVNQPSEGRLCYEVGTCGTVSGTWKSTPSCSPPSWTSNPTSIYTGNLACCSGSAATFTVGT